MRGLLQDLRFSSRELRKNPGLALTAIVSLALGIGATTAVFSVIYGLLVNPFPYDGADRMVYLNVLSQAGEEGDSGVTLTGSQLKTLAQAKCIERLAAGSGESLTTTDADLPEDVPTLYVTPNAGSYFGVPALLGRTLIPSDAREGQDPQPVAVLGYMFWLRHFNADPAVIGRTLELVHRNYTIVGVMPPRFTWWGADVYLPLKVTGGKSTEYRPFIKLRQGVSQAAANSEFEALLAQFAKETPNHFPKKIRVNVRAINYYYEQHLGKSLFLLFGAVALLLLIGCGNVSILLLARGTARQHELAVRAAVGAGRWRIQRQLLTEAVMLSLIGALGGIVLAYNLLPAFLKFLPEQSFPHAAVIQVNVPVLVFSTAVALLTGVLFGLSPALEFSRPQLAQLMQSTSRRTTAGAGGKRAHGALAAGQIALTLVLLTSAAAAINGFLGTVRTRLGYDPHNVMSVGIPVHRNAHLSWEDRSVYFERIRSHVAALPEATGAAISTNATPPSNGSDQNVEIFGRPMAEQQQIRVNFVSPEYFPVLHIPLLQGRLWDRPEMAHGARLAVINSTMARQFWPNGDAIGKQIRIPDLKPQPPLDQAVPDANGWLRIIGVVADARNDGLRKPVKPAVFVPFSMDMGPWTQILVRTRGAPLSILNRVRGEVKAIDPDQQVYRKTADLEQWISDEEDYAYPRLVAVLFSGFSILALALAAVGLFSVVSYGVAQRTNEFGIRMALGAMRTQLLQLVIAATVRNVIAGVAAGLALSILFTRFLSRWAEGSAYNPLFFAAVTLLLLLTSACAALIPARRASAVDPMQALRYE